MATVSQELKERFAFSPSPEMAQLLGQRPSLERSLKEKAERWTRVIAHIESSGILGLILKRKDREQWVFISPDAQSGQYRYSAFDRQGFFGDGVRLTPEHVLVDVFADGFQIIEAATTLDDVAANW